MSLTSTFNTGLKERYAEESARIRASFAANGNGRETIARRTALVEGLTLELWKEFISPDEHGPSGVALIALGGFGRGWLFPHSDIDLLFLHASRDSESDLKDPIRGFSQALWDLHLKLSPATRTLSECDRFDPNNVEFTLALLDARYLAGDRDLFTTLHDKLVPKLIVRESQTLVQTLAEVTRARHAKFGNTVFHLEPNLKDAPGGMRDYNVACWLALISAIDKLQDRPDPKTLLSSTPAKQLEAALEFLVPARCFLHFRHGRDDNALTWDAQEEAAAQKIGAREAKEVSAADWMRIYFGHARSVHRAATLLLEEITSSSSSLYREFQSWRSRLSNADFSVVHGFVFLQQVAALQDPMVLLHLFYFSARHGLQLGASTEYRVRQVLPALAATPPRGAELWLYLGEILAQRHAGLALRAMHSLQLLTLLLPELKPIDALVIRDFYHRYTVDEHSFRAIETLHELSESSLEWDKRYGELLAEVEQPELLYLALLLHDTGKGVALGNHVEASLEITEQCMDRLDLEPGEREAVQFLVGNHLEMSAALRRDIFSAETIHSVADRVGTPERLKMLCLMTYADIKAVSPDALSPWKAENLWQLYIATSNHLNRSVDERVRTDAHDETLLQLRSLAPIAGKRFKSFLEGLPQRYLRSYPAEEVLRHMEMAEKIVHDPVQLALKRARHWFELTLITPDRPFLFATVAGALAAWGMNIVKANAFSNQAGTVVDTFYFTDRYRTLELNLPEWKRLERSLSDILTGQADLNRMLDQRIQADAKNGTTRMKVPTRIEIDNQCSAHSTLVQVVAQDRLGLLHRIASCISSEKCNIEIAVIDTEGRTAIDVFYLTHAGEKLTPQVEKRLKAALAQALSPT
jgi:[protein-PII] uridylyltransferase